MEFLPISELTRDELITLLAQAIESHSADGYNLVGILKVLFGAAQEGE